MRLFSLISAGLAVCHFVQAADRTVFDFSLVSLDGKNAPLSTYKDKVLLIAIVADKSQYSGQLAALEELYQKNKDAGLEVLGVPTVDFGGEALASKQDLTKIYREQAKLTFPVFAPAVTRDKKKLPLFEFLSGQHDGVDGSVHWLFTKLLFNRAGKLVASFPSDLDPASPEFVAAVEKTLANQELNPKKDETAKPKVEEDSEE
jgi:glutathione peroxidase